MCIFDGFSDLIVGSLIDKTDGKLGKFHLYNVIGNIILTVTVLLIFFMFHLVRKNLYLIYRVLYRLYLRVYIKQLVLT
ncbi:MAG: MFS transporter [Erysipelotrichaceae bacterium]|nr:MFS transporter [Erysipelotrichaceae bacterium]